MSKQWWLQSGEGRVVKRKMKETSCLLGVGPVAGKSTVKEAIYLCKSLPVTDSPGPRWAIVDQPMQRKKLLSNVKEICFENLWNSKRPTRCLQLFVWFLNIFSTHLFFDLLLINIFWRGLDTFLSLTGLVTLHLYEHKCTVCMMVFPCLPEWM